MKRTAFLTLVFSIAFAVFFIGPPFLGFPFPPYPLMKVADVLDLFTPLVLIPIYWLLFRNREDETPSSKKSITFMVVAAIWVLGQGMHLSANSVGHFLERMGPSDAAALNFFYDEVLSHYIWHAGIMGMSGLIVFNERRSHTDGEKSLGWIPVLGGIIHGFTFFLIVVEGQTWPLGVPFAGLFVLFCLVWGLKKLKRQPLLLFFFTAYAVATLFIAGWWIYWGSLIEFSKVGII